MAAAHLSTQRHPRLEPSGMDDGTYDDDDDQVYDKQWASKYILGPLYEPEPSEEFATRIQGLPVTSPPCASPTRPAYGTHRRRSSLAPTPEHSEELPLLRRILSRSNSLSSKPKPPPSQPKYSPVTELERKKSLHTASPPTTRWNQGTLLTRSYSVASSRPTVNEANKLLIEKGWGVRRAVSLAEHQPKDHSHRFAETLTQKLETLAQQEDQDTMAREGEYQTGRPRRSSSLRERYPGDMSHRPLAMLERDYRAADRAPYLHNPRRQQPIDIIDTLDLTGAGRGVTYHHEGPYDATMASRNRNKKYSPVEAVKDSNMEALKATPREYVQDSLVKHVPLQGTAVVPPGMQDFAGRTMDYQEGTDMMREGATSGNAYKRWEGYQYHPDDLKGKGEPSYTIEKQLKDHKAMSRRARGYSHGGYYASKEGEGASMIEMQPRSTHHLEVPGSSSRLMGDQKEVNARVRQRSVSNAAATGYRGMDQSNGYYGAGGGGESSGAASDGVRRRNTTGKNIAQSLKRRLGSIRRKKEEV
ncbi:hypothetical protein QBC32DRAFT_343171 [Pseudoneurospora amorphoporcata]|uniref:Pal1 cell morphology n=1 Tax=Pseudoneurospora amorphoporcata TaxID=241081 RepID=A0AAN6NVF9_9PEZI|nr:hypothetical protein QBC32DRAFT_343171 [Pseudoneurospora amorphoporcata]